MIETSGNHPEISFYDNQEIEYYIHKARVMRALYIAAMFRRIGIRIMNLFKHTRHTPSHRAGKPVRV